MNLQAIQQSVHRAFFPVKFKNEKIKNLHDFIAQNDQDAEHWQLDDLLGDFINIIKNFNWEDIQYFFKNIKLWNSYHLVIIADKLLDNNVKASVKLSLIHI